MKSFTLPLFQSRPLLLLCTVLCAGIANAEEKIQFNRDIRPILSNSCFTCHGPDAQERQAGLRLDEFESATTELDSGEHAIVPGNSKLSELIARLTTDDSSMRMPPEDSGAKPLTKQQVDLLRKWIDQGATYQGHWSFIAPKRSAVPKTKHANRVRNPIDQFIFARLEKEGLEPSPEADKTTLIRRVTFDLTGLPPTPAEVDAFLADKSANAYEKLVDRLLGSKRYGEQMARYWLDRARYGDTHGMHLDNYREIWLYRDWIIKAFNDNKPFDQFTIEQLAGDLLPNATLDQKIATGFNRCNVTTSEGGSIDEEFYVRYAVERAETTSTVWLGLTAGCAVCHDHKFDPLTQKEFYQLYAFFNSTTERAMDGNKKDPPPVLKKITDQQRRHLKDLESQIATLETAIESKLKTVEYTPPATTKTDQAPAGRFDYVWVEDNIPEKTAPSANGDGPLKWEWVSKSESPVESGKKSFRRTATGLSQVLFHQAQNPLLVGEGDVFFAYVYLDPANPPREIMLQFKDSTWNHRMSWGEALIPYGEPGSVARVVNKKLPAAGKWVRLEVPAEKVGLQPGSKVTGIAFTQFDGTVHWDHIGIRTKTEQQNKGFFSLRRWRRYAAASDQIKRKLPSSVSKYLPYSLEELSRQQTKDVTNYFLLHVYPKTKDLFQEEKQQLAKLKKEKQQAEANTPTTLVMHEMEKQKPAFVLIRGAYDQKGERVSRGVPKILPPLPAEEKPDRLTLARWLVAENHPLTSRVTVNRYWQRIFGTGLVETSEDFGSQGEWPSHPELLDWLALEFMQTGWDIKKFQRLLVTSATYRQSSRITPQLVKRDPLNRLLARGPRFRLDAEVIRDQALFLSGLLVEKIGGPSVKPYQPSGLWKAVGYTSSNTANFKQDHGEKLYRRSMYTFWKRTAPPPTMSTLDAPSREVCITRRARTNTPLQALALMNDIQFFEASRKFAERILLEGGTDIESQLAYGFRMATLRQPTEREQKILIDAYQLHLEHYQQDEPSALKLLSVGESPRNKSLAAPQLAAMTMIANMILNLNETITKG